MYINRDIQVVGIDSGRVTDNVPRARSISVAADFKEMIRYAPAFAAAQATAWINMPDRYFENGASKATICANTLGVPAMTSPLYI